MGGSARRPVPGPDACEFRLHCPPRNACGWVTVLFYGRVEGTFFSASAAWEWMRRHPFGRAAPGRTEVRDP